MLQDSNNELQKASIKTPLNYLDYVSPYTGNKRIEYLNQTPVMVAIMLDTEITGKNGDKSNLWDALNADGTLKPNFATEENIKDWEEGNGPKAKEFKKNVSNAIVTAHGNYDKLRGMMAKESIIGKTVMMFKTWMGSQLYQRLAIEQDDLSSNARKYKGRYRSHTKMSAALHGAIGGFAFAGLPGLAGGAILGAGIAIYAGKAKSEMEMQGYIGMLKESAFLLKGLMRKMAGTPINYLSGREIIKEYSNYDKLQGSNFTERDMKNMKSLIAEMSTTLTFVLLGMLGKSLLWDDDDEDDDPRRIAHNITMNYVAQLVGSATSYLYLPSIAKSYSTTALGTFLDNTGKVIAALEDYQSGNDIALTGSNAGESKLLKAAEKIALPAFMKDDMLGFGTLAERQFKPQFYDDWFWDSEKTEQKVIDEQRILARKLLEEQGLDDKQINRILNQTLKRPKDVIDTQSRTATESVKKPKKAELTEEQKQRIELIKQQLLEQQKENQERNKEESDEEK